MGAAAAKTPATVKVNIGRIAATSLAATTIEWYDFFIYGTAAALVFPKLFFAASLPPAVAQIAAYSTFAVGFVARPVGGVLFGHFGDRVGRKRALVTALLMMGFGTTAIGLMPSYAQIGVAAPIILILLRFLQGLAVGGQWGGAVLLAVENAPPEKRGFYGSFAQMGVPAGVFLSNAIFLTMGANVSVGAFAEWGWRVPFLLSFALVGLAIYVQLKLEDTADFRALMELEAQKQAAEIKALATEKSVSLDKARELLRAKKASPILRVLAKHPIEILLSAGAFIASNATFYLMVTYAVSYATKVAHFQRNQVLTALLIGSGIGLPTIVIASAASDRWGRRVVYMTGVILAGLWAFPFFQLINMGTFAPLVFAVTLGLMFNVFQYGPQAALMTEIFSTEFRYSGASLGYQIGAIFGGGFAPIIAEALFNQYKSSTPISIYWAILCVISLVSVYLLTARHRSSHMKGRA